MVSMGNKKTQSRDRSKRNPHKDGSSQERGRRMQDVFLNVRGDEVGSGLRPHIVKFLNYSSLPVRIYYTKPE